MTTAILVGVAAIIGLFAMGRRLLLAWYVWEVGRRGVPRPATERILTYPLA